MSVVAVKVYKEKIVMAADSIIVHGWGDKSPVGRDKMCEVNGMLIGASGDASECTHIMLFAENHTPLEMNEREITKFMNEYRSWRIKELGLPPETGLGSQYLIAYKGKVFYCAGNNYIGEVKDFFAIGAGDQYASAAMYLGHSPYDAVKVACALSCYVDEPIIEKTISKE